MEASRLALDDKNVCGSPYAMVAPNTQIANSFPAPGDSDARAKLSAFLADWVRVHRSGDHGLNLLIQRNLVSLQEQCWPQETLKAALKKAAVEKLAADRLADKEDRARLAANPPDRRSKAAKISSELNVTLTRAYKIMREKTPDPARAKRLVELFPGSAFEQWHRPANKTGKRPAMLEWANRTDFAGCRLYDFVNTPNVYEGPRGDLFDAIRKRYRAGDPIPKHVVKFTDFWLLAAKLADGCTIRALWVEYQAWRIERIYTGCNADLIQADLHF